ncbi:hypothetical protein HPB49_009787 [Dermacentor silvarum]|uniref:Uncharacterized protein n=1 Tax=Dermacentor silvarum TaxID=543639 RepID=A0ACB8DZ47_DERSI|nr:hypothetical protein HPB49_009787 [Dermacentor silvarum]
MDEELQALGLWEEDMTEEQKVELLRVVAASKETAQREEAVRQGHFAPVKHHVPPVSTETRDHITWDRKSPAKGGHATSPQGSDDDEWPTPSSAKQSRPSRRQPVALKSTVRRVYSMEHRLNLQWGKTDEKELEDASYRIVAEAVADEASEDCSENEGLRPPATFAEALAGLEALQSFFRTKDGNADKRLQFVVVDACRAEAGPVIAGTASAAVERMQGGTSVTAQHPGQQATRVR